MAVDNLQKSKRTKNSKIKNVAGIIPLATFENHLSLPYDDYLLPTNDRLVLLHQTIFECSVMGCNSIWLVVSKETQPLIRTIIGDFVNSYSDLMKQMMFGSVIKMEEVRKIPIYYVLEPEDYRLTKKGLGWDIIYGALQSLYASKMVGNHTTPQYFYISFPNTIVPLEVMANTIGVIRQNKNLIVEHKKNYFRDGSKLPIGIRANTMISWINNIKDKINKQEVNEEQLNDFSTISGLLNPGKDSEKVELTHNVFFIDTWESYLELIKSDFAKGSFFLNNLNYETLLREV
jgi:hypothetical protein